MQARHEAVNDGEGLVRQWRVTHLGIPGPPAQAADRVGWHQTTRLARRGCAPALVMRIAR